MEKVCAIILAAGEGTRMKSDNPKVLAKVLFKPMIKWVIDALKLSGVDDICIVGGYKISKLKNYIYSLDDKFEIIVQNQRKGTAHAVMMAHNFLKEHNDSDVFIVNGDSPFIDSRTIMHSYNLHRCNNNAVTVVSAEVDNPFGYGRIVRNNENSKLTNIVEQKDATEQVNKIKEVNSGAYWFKISTLIKVLKKIGNDNAQNEYYLPDAVKLIVDNGLKADAMRAWSDRVVMGANDCIQLSELNSIAREKILRELMMNGLQIPFEDGIIIGTDVSFGKDCIILPGTIIKGNCNIGNRCVLGPNTYINSCCIGNEVVIEHSYCSKSKILPNTRIGPYEKVIEEKVF